MSTASQFEARRRERQRRARLRKKRIRAAIILVALICAIVLIIVFNSTSCTQNNTDANANADNAVTDVSPAPEEAAPTDTPSHSGTLNIPAASTENDLLKIINKAEQNKSCYLTFDDGPTTNITPQILDVLRRYNVKATFFEVGSLIEANPDIARRVYEEGHLIANHSSGHNYEKLYASTNSFINEINKCYETIKTVCDDEEPFKLVRFPGGSYKSSADSYSPVKQECKEALKKNNFYYCDWNALNGDAEGKKKNAQELLEYLKKNMDLGENLVVLMHDASTKQATVDGLGAIIEYLSEQGYTFCRLDDIEFKGTIETPKPTTPSNSSSSSSSGSSNSDNSKNKDDKDSSSKATSEPTQKPTSRPTAPPKSSGTTIVIE